MRRASKALVARFHAEPDRNFADAIIDGYEYLLPEMVNDPKDRHVAAAAVHGKAAIILTLNLKHFRSEHLSVWGVQALHPQTFFIDLYREDPAIVMAKLERQAADRSRPLAKLPEILSLTAPDLSAMFLRPDRGSIPHITCPIMKHARPRFAR